MKQSKSIYFGSELKVLSSRSNKIKREREEMQEITTRSFDIFKSLAYMNYDW